MEIKRIATIALPLGAFLIAAGFRVLVAAGETASPFTARQYVLEEPPTGGQMIVSSVEVTSVRRDRAKSLARSLPNSSVEGLRKVTFPSGDHFAWLIPHRLMSSGHLEPGTAKHFLAAVATPRDCVGLPARERWLRFENVVGREAAVVQYDAAACPQCPKEETTRITEWRDPDLACFVLRSTREIVGPSERRLVSERVTAQLSLADPDAEAFSVPVGYAEVPPSEQERALLTSQGGAPDSEVRAAWGSIDRFYYKKMRGSK